MDFLQKKLKKNEGEVPQYYVEGNHEAIIDPKVFDLVQKELDRRANGRSRYSGVTIFSNKIKCGDCGCWYGSKVWHSTDKYRKIIYRCNSKYKGQKCKTPTLTEEEIKAAFIKAMNIYLGNKDEIICNIEAARKILCDTSELEKEKAVQAEEMNIAAELIHKVMDENARRAKDQDEYEKKYAALDERYREAEETYRDAGVKILEQAARNRMLCQMILKSLRPLFVKPDWKTIF